MRKLFDFSGCMGDAPQEPDAPSTDQAWAEYRDEFNRWYYSCLSKAEHVNYPPPHLPDEFADAKGNIWVRTISTIGVDFKMELFDARTKARNVLSQNGDSVLIIGLRISPKNGYHLMTLGKKGISIKHLRVQKVKLRKLLYAASNNLKIPDVDLNKMSVAFWGKAPFKKAELALA